MKRRILSWTFVILWMVLIFIFSHQPASESSELSLGFSKKIMDIIKFLVPDNKLSYEGLHILIRKGAHFTIYLILGLLVTNAFRNHNLSALRLIVAALLICVLYAISDEIHQLYIPGRSGQVSDVLIDSTGGLCGILLMNVYVRIHKNRKL